MKAMTVVDDAVILVGIMLTIILYAGTFVLDHPRARIYLKQNMGAPLIIAFVVLLISAAVSFSFGDSYWANVLSEWAYFAILAGVILQVISLRTGRSS